MKNPKDTIGNRTRDLPACSAVPQPTAPPRVPQYYTRFIKYLYRVVQEVLELVCLLLEVDCQVTSAPSCSTCVENCLLASSTVLSAYRIALCRVVR